MTLAPEATASRRAPKPMFEEPRGTAAQVSVYLFVLLPTLALAAAVPLAWGWGLGWVDVALFVAFYVISGLGVTVGYHRHFTHGSFKARRALRVALAIAGSTAVQGSVVDWVADHRRHHAYSDKEGDPHSPWMFGSSPWALAKGFWHAHMGWLFERESTNKERFAPDLLADRDILAVDRLFGLWTALSLLLPGVLGGLISWSWWGALTGFFWAGLVRTAVLHHITWSVNSICHMIGERPFASRDKAANFWPLAIFSFGEAWHNLHHADPTCARHGVLRGQIDISARVIWLFEKFGWVWNVRWPTPQRLARISAK
ncbi:stearoyl-CoA desaturase (delta-9 desaturase) [Streptoalloteichus tenebrarius]|uniref:Stearoyl-CoA desaturase (Delta-9 desaturase) n=2 Tax=Streptoalloteichus tenebrarius (strain ATCC 17920 / DSM 40477 / JCM 4838 / CBS 697.72 / NBRC 16177 / NCIMB 11028 / NRRL B-12390 / A12253. 1 / ISP 5477) TaxID=1933 RepID=A0ABT1HTZ9_STRSD|nr:stearoyl-CoA desaturase (delta-9 desaturase) [Streptoalloteichus tenebrarius]BFF01214.1 acyl-CoA desaturase [Streptoalloteichus tenebrarius]